LFLCFVSDYCLASNGASSVHATALVLSVEIFRNKSVLDTTSAFGDESRRMLKVFRRFGNHCSCHLQGKCDNCNVCRNAANFPTFDVASISESQRCTMSSSCENARTSWPHRA
jgi:hypothetical protein